MLLQPKRTQRIRKAPSKLRPLLFRVVGVLAVLVLIEFGARACIDSAASRSIHNRTVGIDSVDVGTGDAPVVLRYWFLGGLQNGSVMMRDIQATPVNISALKVAAQKLEFSRTAMITGKADLTGSAPYRVTVVLSPRNLGNYLNTTVRFQSNYLVATIEGHNMHVVPELDGRTIVIADERHTYEVPLPDEEYLPCDPESLGIGNGIAVSCTSDTLPPVLADAAT